MNVYPHTRHIPTRIERPLLCLSQHLSLDPTPDPTPHLHVTTLDTPPHMHPIQMYTRTMYTRTMYTLTPSRCTHSRCTHAPPTDGGDQTQNNVFPLDSFSIVGLRWFVPINVLQEFELSLNSSVRVTFCARERKRLNAKNVKKMPQAAQTKNCRKR